MNTNIIQAKGRLKKIALGQLSLAGGRIKENTNKILSSIKEAKASGADLIIFPELSIPGYCHMDLAYDSDFVAENKAALQLIAASTTGISVLVGFIDQDLTKSAPDAKNWLYNSLAFIQDQEILYTQNKELLPNYGIFNEKRYFQANTESDSPKKILEFEDGQKVGLLICEDLWSEEYSRDIVQDLYSKGANFLITLNASPFYIGRFQSRLDILTKASKAQQLPLVYVNSVGSYDAYDGELVFDGRSLVLNKEGNIIFCAPAFKESISYFDNSSVNSNECKEELDDVKNISFLHDALVLAIREFFKRKSFSKAYIGLSGGIDSALVAALAVSALGADNVIGITMPSHITSDETKSDAYLLAKSLKIKIFERPITAEYKAWIDQFKEQKLNRITKQNKQARIRQSILMEYTNEDPGSALLNTGNKTEIALGYFTLGGDSAGALSVIGDVNKLQVYELSKYINSINKSIIIPETTITRPPTAELEEGQTDEASLPAAYSILVPLVEDIIVNNLTKSELIERYDVTVVDQVFRLIRISEGKRRQLPPAIRVSKKAFGLERRIPMDHTFLA